MLRAKAVASRQTHAEVKIERGTARSQTTDLLRQCHSAGYNLASEARSGKRRHIHPGNDGIAARRHHDEHWTKARRARASALMCSCKLVCASSLMHSCDRARLCARAHSRAFAFAPVRPCVRTIQLHTQKLTSALPMASSLLSKLPESCASFPAGQVSLLDMPAVQTTSKQTSKT